MINIQSLIRENIRNLTPYSSARDEYTGKNAIFLDANENPIDTGYNRYPDPYQNTLKTKISELKGIDKSKIFLGNGSDEAIDLLFRAFCEPKQDNVILLPPTYGMYQVSAEINNVNLKHIPLIKEKLSYRLDVEGVENATDKNTKMIYICSPNNPTANSFALKDIEEILQNSNALVVVDEAYIDFSSKPSLLTKIENYPNLVVLQTFSKAWGLAAIRLGMAFAHPEIIKVLSNIKAPYNINALTQDYALKVLENTETTQKRIDKIIGERSRLINALKKYKFIKTIYPSDANFILVETESPKQIYDYLIEHNIVVRDRSKVILCEGCLRITVGTEKENNQLLRKLDIYN